MHSEKEKPVSGIHQALGINFKDPSLLQAALVHTSYINENPSAGLEPNERLEFLGDAVLGHIIAEKLYHDFPQYDEGRMTKVRAELVREETLTRIAKKIRLGDYLYLGKGEAATGGREKPANLSSAMEAVFAALYLDGGLEAVKGLVERLYSGEIEKAVAHADTTDYKSRLQEVLQSRYQRQPEYYLVAVKGPDHARTFTVEVRMGDTVLGRGTGHSKKTAEMEAARKALSRNI